MDFIIKYINLLAIFNLIILTVYLFFNFCQIKLHLVILLLPFFNK